jgi:c-di-GMP-binding flagellar brake protein YcgR
MSEPRKPTVNPAPSIPPSGLMSHRPEDIARVLDTLNAQRSAIIAFLGPEDTEFRSHLLEVDPNHHYIVVASPGPSNARELLARAHVTFISDFNGWHIEFAAAEPQLTEIGSEPAIRLKFPAIISSQQQRRTEPRVPVPGRVPLHCEADRQGLTTFDGELVDVSHGGIGFLTYDSAISLQPGTVLKGTRIQRPGKPTLIADLEVRYSKPVLLPNGQRAHRSGCVFLNPTREIAELIASFGTSTGDNRD